MRDENTTYEVWLEEDPPRLFRESLNWDGPDAPTTQREEIRFVVDGKPASTESGYNHANWTVCREILGDFLGSPERGYSLALPLLTEWLQHASQQRVRINGHRLLDILARIETKLAAGELSAESAEGDRT